MATNISAQIKIMQEIGTDAGLAAVKRKHVIARGVKAVNDMQKAVGPSGFEAGLEAMRVEFYQYSFAAYLYPNDPISETSLMNAQSMREKSTSTYDEREKAAYGSTRGIWGEIRKQCDLTDATRSQAAKTVKAAQAATKAEAAPEVTKPIKVRSSKAFYDGFAMLIGQGSAFCDANESILNNDSRAKLIETEFKKFAQAVNEILTKK